MVTNRGKLENRIHVSRIRSLARTVPGMQECHYLLDTGACHFLVERVRLHIVVDLFRPRRRAREPMGLLRCRLSKDRGPGVCAITSDCVYSHEPQRVSWIRYLMEANALVFLASLSVGFDQFLEDDRHINRLEDTYLVWTGICKSRLISEVLPPSHLVILGVLTFVRRLCTDAPDSRPEWVRRSRNQA
jgi:hypothetical protein